VYDDLIERLERHQVGRGIIDTEKMFKKKLA
jgi:hypothetical protein